MFRFVLAQERAEEAEARAAQAAAEREREAAALERRREAAAATALQAWARGVETRQAVSAALEARGLPLLASEQRRRVRGARARAGVHRDGGADVRSVGESRLFVSVGVLPMAARGVREENTRPASHAFLETEQRTVAGRRCAKVVIGESTRDSTA